MRIANNEIILAATDLSNQHACEHLTQLNLALCTGKIESPAFNEPILEVLLERGLQHEEEYIKELVSKGYTVIRIDKDSKNAFEETLEAMHSGVDVIVQAALDNERWSGRADVLMKTEVESVLGEWSYEVIDTKLSNETKGGTILQICLYSQLLEHIQEKLPEYMHVVTPEKKESYRTQNFLAYFRFSKTKLEHIIDEESVDNHFTYPEPVIHCDICKWWSVCDQRRREDDHLSLVADITRLQRKEFESQGINKLESLAKSELPFSWTPARGNISNYEKAHEQARIQYKERTSGEPAYELFPVEPNIGLSKLPEPSTGDIFFDIEGDPFVSNGGLEYLFGYVTIDGDDAKYNSIWALDSSSEREMFNQFMDTLSERIEKYPDFHIYHYAIYEPAALKRLMGRHAICEDILDNLLRMERFVDLHQIVRHSMRASVERYSIKDLEKFYKFNREANLRDASKALREIEWPLELGQPEQISENAKNIVQIYNKDDCLSTYHLREWLESLRSRECEKGINIERPVFENVEISEELSEKLVAIRKLQQDLLEGISDDVENLSVEEHAQWVLAHILEYYRRESKAVWWEYFRLRDLSAEDLLNEKAGIYGLKFIEDIGGTARCPIQRYSFESQETDLRKGIVVNYGEEKIGAIEDINNNSGIIDIKKRTGQSNNHPLAIYGHEHISTQIMEDVIIKIGEWVKNHSIDADGPYRVARNLLLRKSPLHNDGNITNLREQDESILNAAKRQALNLNNGVLSIQGPPGTGKTFTGARVILELIKSGKKVGITAVSHKVIRNQLEKVIEAAEEASVTLNAIQKVSSISEIPHSSIHETASNDDIVIGLQTGNYQLAAGTAWLWSRSDLQESVDVLIVDEAGQMVLAQVVAVAQSCKNLVLLGDPQQLEQPQQGTHPPGTDLSALEYIFNLHTTVPDDMGLFLDKTYRLHPLICDFTSEIFYEGRLDSINGLEKQCITGDTRIDGSGLWYIPVEHNGNQNSSIEEAETIKVLIDNLLKGKWIDKDNNEHQITLEDILIVAPYNAQVSLIAETVGGARVGTVDKFQGQEAPVVIYSMTTSSPEDAPRGMEFLYSHSRLNVATSRSRAACVLIANPALFDPECRTPKQMQLANALCRYQELANTIEDLNMINDIKSQ